MNLKPLHDRLIVRPDAADDMKGGIYLPDVAQEMPSRGIVIAAGAGRIDADGKIYPMSVSEGDHILYGKFGGTPIEVDSEELLMLRESDVYAIIL